MSVPPLQLRRSGTAHNRPAPGNLSEGEVAINYHPSSCGFFIKNGDGNIVKIGPVEISTSAPNSSAAGQSGNSEGELWYDPSSQQLKIFYNGSWEVVASPTPVGFTGEVVAGNITFTIVDGIVANAE